MTARTSQITGQVKENEDTRMRNLGREGIGIWSKLAIVVTVAVWGLAVAAPVLAQPGGDRHWVRHLGHRDGGTGPAAGERRF